MDKSSKKIAPFRTHTRGPKGSAGFMEEEEFTESFALATLLGVVGMQTKEQFSIHLMENHWG